MNDSLLQIWKNEVLEMQSSFPTSNGLFHKLKV